MNYTQLTQEQRYQIDVLLNMGHKQTGIAECLGVHKSTISRELHRNKGLRGCRPKQARQKAMSRRNHTRMRIKSETWMLIEAKIRREWSPEQLSGWMKRYVAAEINHEWIY